MGECNQWLHNIGEPFNKSTIESCKSKKGLNDSYPGGRFPFLNCGHFPLIHGNTIGRDDVKPEILLKTTRMRTSHIWRKDRVPEVLTAPGGHATRGYRDLESR